MESKMLMKELKRYEGVLSKQQYRTLKGQINHGDIDGAKKGLQTLLERKNKNDYNRKI